MFDTIRFQFWSPVVPRGYVTTNLADVEGLELVINGDYKARVEHLQELTRSATP
jgi:hypothetical protein